MMPLIMIKPGVTIRVKKITGNDEVKSHLGKLGFVIGEEVTIISEYSGNLILNVKGTRIALDKSLARRIMI